jgi:hypothetical protein
MSTSLSACISWEIGIRTPKRPLLLGVDLKNTQRRYIESEHALQAFLVVIVGLAPFPPGLYVALMEGSAVNHLSILDPVVRSG